MAVLKYSLLRLGVFAVVFVGCMNLNLGRFTFLYALLIGLVISWAVSYLFFNKWRVAAGDQLAGRFGKTRRSRAEADDNAAEDELAEQYHAEADPGVAEPPVAEPEPADPDAAESADSDPQAAEADTGEPGDSPPPQSPPPQGR